MCSSARVCRTGTWMDGTLGLGLELDLELGLDWQAFSSSFVRNVRRFMGGHEWTGALQGQEQ
jgi:hypothetical protein